jgi:hypothetical protein
LLKPLVVVAAVNFSAKLKFRHCARLHNVQHLTADPKVPFAAVT